MKTYDNAEDVLQFCLDKRDLAIVVLTSVTGGTLRAPGALMAVTPDGHAGYISNGCVDADIIARARSGQEGLFVYGEGSPYRDIVLPCGGRLDVSICQNVKPEKIAAAKSDLSCRKNTLLKIGSENVLLVPRLKLRIAGRGAATVALANMATQSGFDVHVQSPDADLLLDIEHLLDAEFPPKPSDDLRTAMVCLFHDHDWEAALLKQAVEGPCFYVGAMGSEKTHKARRGVLAEIGLTPNQIDEIKGPIGLVPAQRDARLLAISILAEIVQTAKLKSLI